MTRRVLVGEWMMIVAIIIGGVGILAGGWAYHLEQVDDANEEREVHELIELCRANKALLLSLTQNPAARPLAYTACDGLAMAEALRHAGVDLVEQPFEMRCKRAQER
jgi:hypothetical protein